MRAAFFLSSGCSIPTYWFLLVSDLLKKKIWSVSENDVILRRHFRERWRSSGELTLYQWLIDDVGTPNVFQIGGSESWLPPFFLSNP